MLYLKTVTESAFLKKTDQITTRTSKYLIKNIITSSRKLHTHLDTFLGKINPNHTEQLKKSHTAQKLNDSAHWFLSNK